jgi:hypothetical protein
MADIEVPVRRAGNSAQKGNLMFDGRHEIPR